MRTIIAGSRTITDYQQLLLAISRIDWTITSIVCGGARGVDSLGKKYADNNNIPIKFFIPDWARFSKGAGFIRNVSMAKNADALIALWDGKSRGTKHMIDTAKDHNLRIFILTI